MTPPKRLTRRVVVGVLGWASVAAGPLSVEAQLRPLDPLDWHVWDAAGGAVSLGSSFYSGQRASLAGTEGRLYELGTVTASVPLGRVVLLFHGTALRVYAEDRVLRQPLDGTRAPDGRTRRDTGDHQVHTIVRLTEADRPLSAAIRFGVRLPTTDNVVGLERDRTDFFALLAGRARRGRTVLATEVGLGVYGTRQIEPDQVDPILYQVTLAWEGARVRPFSQLVGQWDTRPSPTRGLEDQREVRAGVQWGGDRWVSLVGVAGLTDFSPGYGVGVSVGARF